MAKRTSRKEIAKKLDVLKPIDLTMVGTSKDPCFGKLHDGKHPVCRRCGDAEICQIVMGQVMHAKRANVEEESAIMKTPKTKVPLSKFIRYIRLKLKKEREIDLEQLKVICQVKFSMGEKTYEKKLKLALAKSSKFKKVGDKLKYVKTKTS